MKNTEEKMSFWKKHKILKTIIFILLFIAILLLAYAAYLKSGGLDANTFEIISGKILKVFSRNAIDDEERKIYEISFESKEKPEFTTYDNIIIKCTLYGITSFDKKGNELWSVTVKLDKPLVKTKGCNVLVYDFGGRQMFILNSKGVEWEKSFDGDIINADINKQGFVTVLHELEDYKGIVKVFSPDGQEIFRRIIANTFIFSGEVFPSGNTVVIHGIDISGIGATSHIEFTDLTGQPYAALRPQEDVIFPFLFVFDDDSFIVANDKTVIYFNKNRNKIWSNDYNKVCGAGILNDKFLVAAVNSKEESDSCVIEIIDRQGNTVGEFRPGDSMVSNIAAYKDIAAVNTGREVYFIDSKGNLISIYNTISDIKEVHFLNRNEAVLITLNSIYIIKI